MVWNSYEFLNTPARAFRKFLQFIVLQQKQLFFGEVIQYGFNRVEVHPPFDVIEIVGAILVCLYAVEIRMDRIGK